MGFICNEDLTKIYTTREFPLGAIMEKDNGEKEYRFVKYNSGAGAVVAVAGQIGYMVAPATTGAERYETTMDYSSAAAASAITVPVAAAGFYQAALTDGSYGWVQTKGRSRLAALTDGNVTRNSQLCIENVDGRIINKPAGAPDLPTVAVALADDVATALGAGYAQIDIPN
jgi:hypothetical protein